MPSSPGLRGTPLLDEHLGHLGGYHPRYIGLAIYRTVMESVLANLVAGLGRDKKDAAR